MGINDMTKPMKEPTVKVPKPKLSAAAASRILAKANAMFKGGK